MCVCVRVCVWEREKERDVSWECFIANAAFPYPVRYLLFQYKIYLLTSGLGHTQKT